MIEKNLDILLLSMPVKAIDRPSLSLPVLVTPLKRQGFNVMQRDVNMVFQDILMTEKELNTMHSEILPLLIRLNRNCEKVIIKLESFYKLLDRIHKTYGFSHLSLVKRQMQMQKYEVLEDRFTVSVVEDIFAISSNLNFYFTTIVYYHDFYLKHQIKERITAEVNDLIEQISLANPMVVGFSVMEVQRCFSLWAAKLLKEKYNGVILFGGSDPSLNQEKYLEENPFIDFVCWGDGEYAIVEFVRTLKHGTKAFDKLPNLVYRSINEIVSTEYQPYMFEPDNFPDYEGIPLELYIFPSLQILTSKGCKWSRCKFCIYWNSYTRKFRQREPKDVVNEMETMNKKYNTRLFYIVDEEISANFGARLSEEIISRGLDVRWIQMSRLDANYNEKVFNIIHKAGGRIIEWGLESGSQKVLDDMSKGINVRTVQRLIHESASAGIINKMLMFHNYPVEDTDDLMKSINIIKKNAYFRMLKPMLALRHLFVLKMGTPLAHIAFENTEEKPKYFRKVWKPESVYSLNAKYIGPKRNYEVKKNLVDDCISEMKDYLKKNDVLITDNNNITMDLVLIDLIEKGHKLPVDVYLPSWM